MEDLFPNPNLRQLAILDNENYDPEKIGCHFKRIISFYADFYNDSFHYHGGPIENFLLNFHGECFNTVEGNVYDCNHFYKVFKCYKQNGEKTRDAITALENGINKCKREGSSQNHHKCAAKCAFEMLNLSESEYFNSTIIGNWLLENFQTSIGKFLKNTVEVCNTTVKLQENEVPTLNCKYFQIYSDCWLEEVLKILWKLTKSTPNVKGFILEM